MKINSCYDWSSFVNYAVISARPDCEHYFAQRSYLNEKQPASVASYDFMHVFMVFLLSSNIY